MGRRIVFLLIFPLTILAQNSFESEVHILAGFPQEDFKSESNDSSFGFEGSLGYIPKDLPVTVGFSIAYLNLGESLYQSSTTPKAVNVTQIKTQYDSVYYQFYCRVFKDYHSMEPSFEVLLGYQQLKVNSKINFDSGVQGTFPDPLDHGGVTFGLGGGLAYSLFREGNARKNAIQLYLGGRYSYGTGFEFLVPSSVYYQDGAYHYQVENKKVQVFILKAGLRFIF